MSSPGLIFITDNPATNHLPDFFGMMGDDHNMDLLTFKSRYPELAEALSDRQRAGRNQLVGCKQFSIKYMGTLKLDNAPLWREIGVCLGNTIWLDTIDPRIAWRCNEDFVRLKQSSPIMERFNLGMQFRFWLQSGKPKRVFE